MAREPAYDTPESERLREALIRRLTHENTLRNPRIAAALRSVPRHAFVPASSLEHSYQDTVVPVKYAGDEPISTLSQPSAIVVMLEQLQLEPGMRVLEIGTGTGYNAALLAALVGSKGEVTTVDIDENLTTSAGHILHHIGYSAVNVHAGDGFFGAQEWAPFDRIELSVASDSISPAWIEQMIDGGLLVGPIHVKGLQFLTPAFRKHGPRLVSESVQACRFLPLRGSAAVAGATFRLPVRPELRFVWESPDEFPAGVLMRSLRHEREVQEEISVPWAAAAYVLLTNQDAFFAESEDRRARGIALLDRETESLATIISASDGWGTATVVTYGGDGAHNHLAASIDEWSRRGRPGLKDLRLTAIQSPGPDNLGPGEHLIRKPQFDLIASYDTPR
jgi:protein-L-isoaspartate(D-aspartate) O-methyltransferase